MSTTKTNFHKDTPKPLHALIDSARLTRQRVRFWYGDTVTGQSWHEENDVTGFIGRSTGPNHTPLLLRTKHSASGPALLDHCIIRMDISKKTVYSHPQADIGVWSVLPATQALVNKGYWWSLEVNGIIHANLPKLKQAFRLRDFMTGKRATR